MFFCLFVCFFRACDIFGGRKFGLLSFFIYSFLIFWEGGGGGGGSPDGLCSFSDETISGKKTVIWKQADLPVSVCASVCVFARVCMCVRARARAPWIEMDTLLCPPPLTMITFGICLTWIVTMF